MKRYPIISLQINNYRILHWRGKLHRKIPKICSYKSKNEGEDIAGEDDFISFPPNNGSNVSIEQS
ncbi:MAG: hypothetical protein AYK18_09375 [Theionarchaea archaeon DG-70]|nr:MAG: hypothetical protein AYK18_09375 [Theionarchaea archaeon DG-70]